MKIKSILKAAAAAVTLTLAGVAAADAAPFHGSFGHGGFDHGGFGYRHEIRRIVDHRVVFDMMRARHIRYFGEPYFDHDRYVVRSFDRFGHVAFVQVDPYTGQIIGFVRL